MPDERTRGGSRSCWCWVLDSQEPFLALGAVISFLATNCVHMVSVSHFLESRVGSSLATAEIVLTRDWCLAARIVFPRAYTWSHCLCFDFKQSLQPFISSRPSTAEKLVSQPQPQDEGLDHWVHDCSAAKTADSTSNLLVDLRLVSGVHWLSRPRPAQASRASAFLVVYVCRALLFFSPPRCRFLTFVDQWMIDQTSAFPEELFPGALWVGHVDGTSRRFQHSTAAACGREDAGRSALACSPFDGSWATRFVVSHPGCVAAMATWLHGCVPPQRPAGRSSPAFLLLWGGTWVGLLVQWTVASAAPLECASSADTPVTPAAPPSECRPRVLQGRPSSCDASARVDSQPEFCRAGLRRAAIVPPEASGDWSPGHGILARGTVGRVGCDDVVVGRRGRL